MQRAKCQECRNVFRYSAEYLYSYFLNTIAVINLKIKYIDVKFIII